MSNTRKIENRNRDLDSREEVEILVKNFYADVAQDDLLGPVFNDVAHVDWSEHIPKLVSFWCRNLFSEPGYQGNPMREHQRINDVSPFTHEQFIRWLELFQENVDLGWEGKFAELIKKKAVYIAIVHSKVLTGTPIDLTLNPIRKIKVED